MRVLYDPQHGLAMFEGPGGFTQARMDIGGAEAIARAFGIEFKMCRPGTTIPEEG